MVSINKTIVFALLLFLLVLPLSSALVKEVVYNSSMEYPYYRIWNNDQTTLLAELKLIHNTKQCSNNCEAVIKLDLKTSWTLPDNPNNQFQFKFWDKARSYLRDNDIQDVKLQVSATNETILDSVGEEHSVPKYVNIPWGNTINAGVKYIRLTGSKAPEDEFEWIPDFMGLNLYEWATWENAYVQADNYTLWLNNVAVFGDTASNTGFTINSSSMYIDASSSNYQHGALHNFSVPLNTSNGKWVNISFVNTQTHQRYTHIVLMNKSRYGPSFCRSSYNGGKTADIAIYQANPSEADGGGNCGVGSGGLDDYTGIADAESNINYNMNFNGSRLEIYREGSLIMEYNAFDNQKLGDIGKNYDSITLPEGTPVVFSGVQGSHKLFIRANANNQNTSSIVGVVIRNVPTNQFAFCSVFGDMKINDFSVLIENYNAANVTFGTKLYLSATTAGKYSLTVPDRPNAAIWVATVTDFNASNGKGSMFIYPQRLRVDGDGLNIQVSLNQPTNQVIGDLWYDID
jgi:hypothetical protein